tara:strand:+ start:10017 stop:10211 length:195 start_codon:yes stop_codon:yes gene_type:complete
MSTRKTIKESVKISENDLVAMIEGIVLEEVAKAKGKWLQEQKVSKEALLENRLAALEKRLSPKK